LISIKNDHGLLMKRTESAACTRVC